jgi:hypothetical protein
MLNTAHSGVQITVLPGMKNGTKKMYGIKSASKLKSVQYMVGHECTNSSLPSTVSAISCDSFAEYLSKLDCIKRFDAFTPIKMCSCGL